ncbi:MAG: response regulator [Vicinamibacteria bacterium]|jgi:CheY-like chemotaxis protein|nr:response regulator [Vicinamibacteria bacterium]
MGTGSRQTILVVDDSSIAVTQMSLLLRRMGFRVVSARDGGEALRLVSQEQPDGIMLDLHMPGMDGFTFMRRFKQMDDFDMTPVIVVTVDSDPAVEALCMQLGCRAYLHKPVGIRELYRQIQTHVKPNTAKRRHLRATFGRNVFVTAEGRRQEIHAVSLSEGGIYLRMPEPIENGTMVAVDLPLDNDRTLTVHGKVAYGSDVNGTEMNADPNVGIVFTDLTAEQSFELTTLIKRLLMANLFHDIHTPWLKLNGD